MILVAVASSAARSASLRASRAIATCAPAPLTLTAVRSRTCAADCSTMRLAAVACTGLSASLSRAKPNAALRAPRASASADACAYAARRTTVMSCSRSASASRKAAGEAALPAAAACATCGSRRKALNCARYHRRPASTASHAPSASTAALHSPAGLRSRHERSTPGSMSKHAASAARAWGLPSPAALATARCCAKRRNSRASTNGCSGTSERLRASSASGESDAYRPGSPAKHSSTADDAANRRPEMALAVAATSRSCDEASMPAAPGAACTARRGAVEGEGAAAAAAAPAPAAAAAAAATGAAAAGGDGAETSCVMRETRRSRSWRVRCASASWSSRASGRAASASAASVVTAASSACREYAVTSRAWRCGSSCRKAAPGTTGGGAASSAASSSRLLGSGSTARGLSSSLATAPTARSTSRHCRSAARQRARRRSHALASSRDISPAERHCSCCAAAGERLVEDEPRLLTGSASPNSSCS